MKVRKIFSPDLMFNNFIKNCWSDNIETVAGNKIPINEALKEEGIFALDIKPKAEKEYWIAGLPVNKDWTSGDIVGSVLEFEAVTSDPFNIKIEAQDEKGKTIWNDEVKITNTDSWSECSVKLPPELKDIKILLFTGPASLTECLLKNIVIK